MTRFLTICSRPSRVKLLLDTHVFLWLLDEPERLDEHSHVLGDARTELILSAVSSWEIAIKYKLGKLGLPEPPEHYVPDRWRALGATPLAIEHAHALAVASLPRLHGDPFDRLLVAQATLLGLTILTADPAVAQYPAPTLLVS
jgi:PIN domain nuclease of toxin-antitoxin system